MLIRFRSHLLFQPKWPPTRSKSRLGLRLGSYARQHSSHHPTASSPYRAHRPPNTPVFSRRTIYLIATSAIAFFYWNVETVPGSGRRRFNCVPERVERYLGLASFQEILIENQGRVLPANHPLTKHVQSVLDRLLQHADLKQLNREDWEVKVVRSGVVNACAFPGNKIIVFTGILPFLQNDDALAAVLGHEISHIIAHHVSEQISRRIPWLLPSIFWMIPAALGFSSVSETVYQLTVELPGTREQESEADYLGLMMMAQSCYNPEEAARYWTRMHHHEKRMFQQAGVADLDPEKLQLVLTHPMSDKRIEQINQWLPEVRKAAREAGCGERMGREVRAFDRIRRMVL